MTVSQVLYTLAVADCGNMSQAAQRLYRSIGFREIERYNDSPMDDATYMKLEL